MVYALLVKAFKDCGKQEYSDKKFFMEGSIVTQIKSILICTFHDIPK